MSAFALIFISMWTMMEVYEVLGDFGWFYGDFFIQKKAKAGENLLDYSGIYRYINNPEIFLGHLWYVYLFFLSGMTVCACSQS